MEKLKFPNPKYLENARMGRWNRGVSKELRFFDKVGSNGLWIPRGYIRHLVNMCRKEGIAYIINDQRRSLPEVNFTFKGKLKPFQKNAVDIVMAKEFGTLSAPTGSGKTVMALFMIAQRKQPTLIIVHTKELAFQWIERIETFLNIPSDQVGLIGSGQRRIGNKITVALVQSLYRCAEEVAPSIGHLVVDECHRAPSRTFTEAVTEFDSRFMLGLSATPFRRDKLSKLIFWHLGEREWGRILNIN
jgi:superfamily II DNA or RNA helicase